MTDWPNNEGDSASWVDQGQGSEDLYRTALELLTENARSGFISPARGLYVHQHLWDTCFIAIGQRHYDLGGAMGAIRRLFETQWNNGMVPHIRFEPGWRYWWDRRIWRSDVNPSAPRTLKTGGITQPPMIAEAVVRVGRMLPHDRRLEWYKTVFQPLVAYHEWLHLDRGGHGRGLVFQIHPWETGLDNSPPLLALLRQSSTPWWLKLVAWSKLDSLATRLRWDTRYVPADQRSSTLEALRLYDALRRIRRYRYEADVAVALGPFAIYDLTFNSILVRANDLLREIGDEIAEALPSTLDAAVRNHRSAMEELWDASTGSYFSRNAGDGNLIKVESIAAFMPLYAGCVDGSRASQLVQQLSEPGKYAVAYPIPTVPVDSPWFNPLRYWQGPTWINMNWLVIDGLRRYGFAAQASELRSKTLALVSKNGFREYYHPLTGEPAGAKGFSWTASLTVDLLLQEPRKA